MTKARGIFILSIMLILASSCSKSPSCNGEDENNGIIEEYFRIHDFPMCIEAYVNENRTMVIRTEEELSAIIDSNCVNLPEAGYSEKPPELDFNKHTLLGFWATGACEVTFIREVTRDDNAKKYYYKINVIECGLCEKLEYDANLVLVPSLPEGFHVDFLLNNSKFK